MLYLIAYAALTGIVVAIEHLTFGRWWARNELARRTMGHATILFLALIFVPFGLIDLTTLAAITIATGTAGAVTAAMYVNEAEQRKRRQADQMRRQVEEMTDGDETA